MLSPYAFTLSLYIYRYNMQQGQDLYDIMHFKALSISLLLSVSDVGV